MGYWIYRLVFDLGISWILAEKVFAFPVFRWSDWPSSESAAAVWTDIPQRIIDTLSAEGAFVGTNARFKRSWRKRLITVLAGWSEFKHRASFM
jgi:hypothetical protein